MKKMQQKPKAKISQHQTAPIELGYKIQNVNSINTDILESFAYEYAGKKIIINIETNEFTALCPWSGLPDYAKIQINYIPKKLCIELRSLKYYLISYRNVGIYQEHVVNRILMDLVRCCKPKWIQVIADYNLRGGVHTTVSAEWGKQ